MRDNDDPAAARITVVIPAHNEASYLEAALASVLAQDYPTPEHRSTAPIAV